MLNYVLGKMMSDNLIIIVSVVYLCTFCTSTVSYSPIGSTSSCPIDLNYILTLPWDSSACQNQQTSIKIDGNYGTQSTCCQTLTSLYGIGLAQHLKHKALFRLPDMNTSISCLSDFKAKLDSLSLPSFLTSMCFEAQHFVNGTNVCANIQTQQDWLDAVGPSTSLGSACRQDLTDLSSCDACVLAGFEVQSQLVKIGRNSSHARGCFYYTILYAAGVINEHGPESMGAVSCIFGLPLTLEKKSINIGKLALVFGSAGAGSAIIFVFCLVVLYLGSNQWKKKKKSAVSTNFELDHRDDYESWSHWRSNSRALWFKIKDLERATDYFSPKNFIGRGQFGIVYKGTLRDGTMVAVKEIRDSDFQGNAQFINEVEIISNLKHRNLVPLRGYCVANRNSNYDGEGQRFLVYDYMPNGNLSEHLFLSQKGHRGIGKNILSWPQRKSIILDIAKALAYLHYGVKPAIFHRDIKATNILLDADMRARVADFGLARQIRDSESHLTTRVGGTHGYLAPECALYGQLTEKSDVYSFGVVILEIMSGKKALDLSSSGSRGTILITDWAWSLIKVGRIEEVFDPSLLRNPESVSRNPKKIMERFLLVGISCAHLMVALRPTILEALKMLEGDIEVPAILDRPVYH